MGGGDGPPKPPESTRVARDAPAEWRPSITRRATRRSAPSAPRCLTVGADAVRRLRDRELDGPAFAAAHDADCYRRADLGVRRQALEVVVVVHRRALERDDHVVLLETGGGGGAPRIYARDDGAGRGGQAERLRELRRQGLHGHADPAARHA